eukprot:403356951
MHQSDISDIIKPISPFKQIQEEVSLALNIKIQEHSQDTVSQEENQTKPAITLDKETKQELNHAERKLAIRNFNILWHQNELFIKQSYRWETVMSKLTDQLELYIFKKCCDKINEKYRSQVERSKRNLILLHKYPDVTLLFLQGKVGASKIRMNCDKFRRTCLKLERKRKEKDRKNQSDKINSTSEKLKGGQIKVEFNSFESKSEKREKDLDRLKQLLGNYEPEKIVEQSENQCSMQIDTKTIDNQKSQPSRSTQDEDQLEQSDNDSVYSLNNSANFSDVDENEFNKVSPQQELKKNYYNAIYPYDPQQEHKMQKRVSGRSKPIFYDPYEREAPEKNSAPRGSLLQVWTGNLKFHRNKASLKCKFQSTKDIKMFQCLQKWGPVLSVTGKAQSSDVLKYFLSSQKTQHLISGIIKIDQNLDLQSLSQQSLKEVSLQQELCESFYDGMLNEDKFSVVKPYTDNSLTLYIIPFHIQNESLQTLSKCLGINDDLLEASQETFQNQKFLVFAGFLKQKMSLSRNFINPTVLKLKNYIQIADPKDFLKNKQKLKKEKNRDRMTGIQGSYSPISTDQSDNEVQDTKSSSIQKSEIDPSETKENLALNDPDIIEMRELLNIAERGTYSPEQLLKIIQDKLRLTNMIERVNSYDENKKNILQEVLQKLIGFTQPKQQVQQTIPAQQSQQQQQIIQPATTVSQIQTQQQQNVQFQYQAQESQVYSKVQAYYGGQIQQIRPQLSQIQTPLTLQNQGYQLQQSNPNNMILNYNNQIPQNQNYQLPQLPQNQQLQFINQQSFNMGVPPIRPPPQVNPINSMNFNQQFIQQQQQRGAMMHSSFQYNQISQQK